MSLATSQQTRSSSAVQCFIISYTWDTELLQRETPDFPTISIPLNIDLMRSQASDWTVLILTRSKIRKHRITFISRLPPWSHKSDPISTVCTSSIQPSIQLSVVWQTSNVGENRQSSSSEQSARRQTVAAGIVPRQMRMWRPFLVALRVHWQAISTITSWAEKYIRGWVSGVILQKIT